MVVSLQFTFCSLALVAYLIENMSMTKMFKTLQLQRIWGHAEVFIDPCDEWMNRTPLWRALFSFSLKAFISSLLAQKSLMFLANCTLTYATFKALTS